ncbi:NYN domain-containing protein [Ktedonosporobacter rubrisoli]|uniref:NYN domain-containing protein n=1 Tax=Ktedonosporobacter rubrisoli TaxID=2509675 RepID=A0A4P6JVG6_KTERU|nr:NYN domain-containing protein [Ktedonosporobacter rubrisoli]QBD79363.1 NYN domain-containing protein [Ktedonosporobacter rubrisoli]
MPEDIALFIDFENIRYSMLNIQRREPDPQELIAVARRYGTVMVARAYADWSRQPEPFKGSLTAAMIDRVDCPAKQRDRIRMGTIHYSGNTPTGSLTTPSYVAEQGSYTKPWPNGVTGSSGNLPAIQPNMQNGWSSDPDTSIPMQGELDDNLLAEDDQPTEEGYSLSEYQQRESYRQNISGQYGQSNPTGPLGQSTTGPLGYPTTSIPHAGNTGHMAAVNANASGNSTIVQSTVVQSTVDLNMLMDIIETVFDRPTITTFVLMTGDKDFTRISARLKLRLNKTVIVVGIPGTVSRDLISSANQFVPLVPGGSGSSGNTGALPVTNSNYAQMSGGTTGSIPAINFSGTTNSQFQPPFGTSPMDALDPQFLQFLDYIDRNWSWRTIIGVSNFIGDPVNPKNRFRGRLTRESARELLNTCIQQGILLVQTDPTGAEDLRLNRLHPGVDEVLKQFVR